MADEALEEVAEDTVTEVSTEEAKEETKEVPATWHEGWRKDIAGEDEKELKRLDRFQTPKDIYKAFRAAEQKISSGEFKRSDLPEGATEEQIAEFRKDRGIPDKAEGYLESIPDGLVIGDDDKEMAGDFLTAMHEINAPPEFVHTALNWYQGLKESESAAQQEADAEARRNAEDELRADWGGEYRANINSALALLDTMPELEDGTKVKELFMGGRMADGTPLGNHPGVLRWLVQMAADSGHSGFIAPSEGIPEPQKIDDEINQIREVMRTDRGRYDRDPKMQARLHSLLEAQEKLAKRA